MQPKALVTGATGFIGRHLLNALEAQGFDVHATARRPRPAWLSQTTQYQPADLAQDELGPIVGGVNYVFHLAGASSSGSGQSDMERSNVSGTENLLQACFDAGVQRFLYMSSTSVYGEEVKLPEPLAESQEPHPSRGYGKTKWAAEQAVSRFVEKGLDGIVLRPTTVYGKSNTKLLASTILDMAIEHYAGLGSIEVFREPVELRLVDVRDVVGASLHLMQQPQTAGKTFNITSVNYPTSHEIVQILAKQFGMMVKLSDSSSCGLDDARRAATRNEMIAVGMHDPILFTERFRLLQKANINNRLSIDALDATGYHLRYSMHLRRNIVDLVGWYRDQRWIL